MKKIIKILSVAIALVMVFGVFAAVFPTTIAAPSEEPVIADVEKMDIGPSIRAEYPDYSAVASSAYAYGASPMKHDLNDFYNVGDFEWYYAGSYSGGFKLFEKRGEGNYCEVWVAVDLSFPAGDPRNAYTSRITITDEHVAWIIDQFDNNIYPTETAYFSEPPPLDGSNALMKDWGFPYMETNDTGKVMIMIFNIRDANYYNPSYPYYIAGFFSPTLDLYYDRNIINIDCWDWDNRTGPYSPRPWLYEGTVAHEYQHLLHDYLDPDEDTWLNEGCSMYAEMLCGYGIPYDYFLRYLYTPDNSLTDWGDQGDINILADYGGAALFMVYLNDHFGGSELISDLVKSELNGAASVTQALHDRGYADWDFDKVYHAFSLANLIRSDSIGNGLYNYASIDLSPITLGMHYYRPSYGYIDESWWYGTTWTYDGYDTGVSTLGSYGTDYFIVDNFNKDATGMNLLFNGDDIAMIGWEQVWVGYGYGYAWYSGASDLRDVSLIGKADLSDMEEATLTITTYYNIEDFWDFGFVQVSTDGGNTWVSLANEYTTDEADPDAHPAIVENLPGLTGWSEGWVTMSFDLSEYVGQEIMYRFRYMTDWATTYEGWFIDEVYINDVLVDDGGDSISTLEPVYPNSDFVITIYAPGQLTWDGNMLLPVLLEINVNHASETVMRSVSSLLSLYDYLYIIVSTTQGPVNYWIGIVSNLPGIA
ncbi:MAG: immune inhibitor A [Methanomassiliicoccales archaeon]|nr:immune inhibitor A [Methanomassiliicoccales archaeon]